MAEKISQLPFPVLLWEWDILHRLKNIATEFLPEKSFEKFSTFFLFWGLVGLLEQGGVVRMMHRCWAHHKFFFVGKLAPGLAWSLDRACQRGFGNQLANFGHVDAGELFGGDE